jgi:hypothetical protein
MKMLAKKTRCEDFVVQRNTEKRESKKVTAKESRSSDFPALTFPGSYLLSSLCPLYCKGATSCFSGKKDRERPRE